MHFGHFDTASHEYVIDRPDAPQSWTNYLGTKDYATVISHVGGGYSYYKSPEHGRVTRFRQNTVSPEGPGKYVYIRDSEDGDFWSISWMPVGKPLRTLMNEDGAAYTAAHGMGYTRFEADYRGIDAKQTVFIPLDDAVEIWDVTLKNNSDRPRTLSTASYIEFSYHHIEIDNQNLQMSLYATGSSYEDGIIEYDFFYEPWTFHYFASSEEPDSFDTLREPFIGNYRTERNPIAVERGMGSDSSGTTQNHCASLQHKFTLQPGESKRIIYMTGYGSRDEVGRNIQAKYSDPAQVDAEFQRLLDYWAKKRDRLRIDTPNQGMNELINTWTLLQAETTVVWSRFASFVEVGGRHGLGYRDTAQDAMSVIHSNPTKSRQRIIELLRAQTPMGYGLHLFDPRDFDPDREELPDIPSPTIVPSKSGDDLIHGLDDACSDDHLWLVPTVIEYVKETGDDSFLDLVVPFADGSPATVYEHLKAALDFSAEHVGDNGVALGLRADWNDCLNLGGGESALVTFLHAWALRDFIGLALERQDAQAAAHYQAELDRITEVTNSLLWDGAWWIRGYTNQGVKIGTSEAKEGKIFLEHQAWPIIAGIASQEHGEQAMDSVRELLGSEFGSHLNWPAFTEVDDSVGFVTRVYPGVKENSSIFSHPNAWPIIAEAVLGRGDEAVAFYDAISPYNQNDIAEVRGAEPYVYAQFIYGRDHDLYGKAQNPWLTGTAGWMYTAVTKYILGIRPGFHGLVIDPSIPRAWDAFSVRREWRGAVYNIEVRNPDHVSRGVASVTVDGVEQNPKMPIMEQPEGAEVSVVVTLGASV
ncbi:GH36-type glycosyl hydrolase domain-containing protein [Actinomyces minihominis]|uniref:GH36-type glycosyl hydrolase domain-containing protein n=1 Tax=Actinomyces minihominis TaxID=2002838 RepID=UPI000C08CD28|nr:N,N'-diacetylchitobiose phosphorylase [Actinomyces minihominis]